MSSERELRFPAVDSTEAPGSTGTDVSIATGSIVSGTSLESGFRHLRPNDRTASLYLLFVSLLTAGAIFLSASAGLSGWLAAQVMFALAFLQWFVILHEAGHYTLFKDSRKNWAAGHLAGFFALIPFQSWRYIHSRHHRWTGWQDMDATTASLVPRPLRAWEKHFVRAAWASHFPFVSIVYRLTNYWQLSRVRRFVTPAQYGRIRWNAAALAGLYLGTMYLIGPAALAASCWLGLLLSFVAQDLLLLSQHTHIPQHLSHGENVKPFSAVDQSHFTRSLRFPRWFSALILHFDAHELHHMYVHVPGYELAKVSQQPSHEVHWWTWIREAKRMPGDVLLFQNSDDTGFPW